MKVGIVGGRDFNNLHYMIRKLDKILDDVKEPITIVSGGARGADSLAEEYAGISEFETLIFPADWDQHGKAAGFIRNRDIIKNSDVLVAFWDGVSKGTNSSIELAKSKKIPLFLFTYKQPMRKVKVFTDGSADNIKQVGGFAYLAYFKLNEGKRFKKYASKKYNETTNNRMELKAVIKALEDLPPGNFLYEIHSDSKYVIDSVNKGWLRNWVKTGKLDSRKNADLWKRFMVAHDHHVDNNSVLIYNWVKGHDGNQYNEEADQLANLWRKEDKSIKCNKSN